MNEKYFYKYSIFMQKNLLKELENHNATLSVVSYEDIQKKTTKHYVIFNNRSLEQWDILNIELKSYKDIGIYLKDYFKISDETYNKYMVFRYKL